MSTKTNQNIAKITTYCKICGTSLTVGVNLAQKNTCDDFKMIGVCSNSDCGSRLVRTIEIDGVPVTKEQLSTFIKKWSSNS
jgi:hypothetical protein